MERVSLCENNWYPLFYNNPSTLATPLFLLEKSEPPFFFSKILKTQIPLYKGGKGLSNYKQASTSRFWGKKESNTFGVSNYTWHLLSNFEDKRNVIILYLHFNWQHKHTDVTVAVFFHAVFKRSLKILHMRNLKWF